MQNPNQQEIQIKVSDEVLKGLYANMMQVMHTSEEFVIDFMNVLPPTGMINARVIISPGHMKRMIAALQDNLNKYEKNLGQIKPAAEPVKPIGFQAE